MFHTYYMEMKTKSDNTFVQRKFILSQVNYNTRLFIRSTLNGDGTLYFTIFYLLFTVDSLCI